MAASAILEKFQMAISPQRLTIYLYSAHREVIFVIAQLSCYFCCFWCVSHYVVNWSDKQRFLHLHSIATNQLGLQWYLYVADARLHNISGWSLVADTVEARPSYDSRVQEDVTTSGYRITFINSVVCWPWHLYLLVRHLTERWAATTIS